MPSPIQEPATLSPQRMGGGRWAILLLLIGGGLAARLFCLACKSFWFDEAFSVEVARVTWPNFLRLLWWREANMSLYYLLLRIWLHFGQSPFFIRSLSALFAAAGIGAIYWLARLLYDQRTALVAAALLMVNGYQIRYAQEARSYALFGLLATLSSGFLIAFLKRPTAQNRRAYVLTSILAVYAHFYALLLIAAQWLALRTVADANPDSAGKTSVAEAAGSNAVELRKTWRVIALAVAPVVIFVAKTGAGPIKWIKRPGIAELFQFSSDLTNGLPLIYFAACFVAVLPFGMRLLRRADSWEQWRTQFLCIWLLFPILVTVLLSFARPVFLPRYMIFCLPALLLLTAAGIGSLKPDWLSAAVVFIVLLLSSRFVPFVYSHDFDTERDDSIAASNFVLDHSLPGDGLIFHIAETRIPYEFVRSSRLKQNTANPGFKGKVGPEIIFPEHGPGLDYRDFTGKPTPDLLRNNLPRYSRVWVVLMNNGPPTSPDPTTVMLSREIPQALPKVQAWGFAKVELRLYSRD